MKIVSLIVSLALGVLPSTPSRVEYTATGGTQFTFSFKTLSTSHVKVYKNSVLQGSGYSVSLNANQDSSPGGTVTFAVAPSSGVKVRIERTVPLTNESSWTSFSKAKSLELDLDRSGMRDQQIQRNLDDYITSNSAIAAAASNETPVTPNGGTQSIPLREAAAQSGVSVKAFGAKGDGVTDDAAAIRAALASGVQTLVFPGAATWVVASGLDMTGMVSRTLDLGGGTLAYTGTDPMFLMTGAGSITVKNGTITSTHSTVDTFATGGTAAAQLTTYPTVPQESLWSRQLRFENLSVSGFSTVFRLGNFTREVWITNSYITGNATAIKVTGKVANLYVKGSVLYSAAAASQAVLVRGDSGDTTWRYAEGLQFNDNIADVQGTSIDVRDVYLFRWSGGQIKSATGGVAFALTKGVTGLTRDVKISDAHIQAQVNIGAGLGAGFQFAAQLSNVNFNSVQGTAVLTGQYTKGFSIEGASFDQPSGTPVAVAVGADNVNIRLDGLNIDAAYTTRVTVDATSRSGVKGHFSGTWTPTLAFGGDSTGITYGTQAGQWYWTDGVLSGFFQITLTNKGAAAGAATIGGLPFTALTPGTATVGKFASMNTAWTPVLDIAAGESAINLKTGASGSEAIYANTAFSNTSVVNGSFTYPVAQ